MRLAPLVSIPQSPVPPGGGAEWVTGAGGAQLRAALFTPKGRARGSVVLSTGRTEAIEKYFEVITDLLNRGFVVLCQEWRGQGLSHRDLPDRLKGHARGVQPYLDDFAAILAAFEGRMPKPWLAIGHSMGGCLTLMNLAKGQAARFAGAVLCAPMLGVRAPPMARLLVTVNMLLGNGPQYARPPVGNPYEEAFEGNVLTHDPVRFARGRALIAANHDLALSAPTWGWMDFALTATRYLGVKANLQGVKIPVVIVSASDDKLVTDGAQRQAAADLPDGKFISVAGAEHEILMETDDKRDQFWTAFDALADSLAPKLVEPAARSEARVPAVKARPAAKAAPKARGEAASAPKGKAATKPAAEKPAATAAQKVVAKKPAATKTKVEAASAPKAKPATRKPASNAAPKVAVKKPKTKT